MKTTPWLFCPIPPQILRNLFGDPSNNRIALIDELAAAASILMGQKGEGIPAVLIRGVSFTIREDAHIADILT